MEETLDIWHLGEGEFDSKIQQANATERNAVPYSKSAINSFSWDF